MTEGIIEIQDEQKMRKINTIKLKHFTIIDHLWKYMENSKTKCNEK